MKRVVAILALVLLTVYGVASEVPKKGDPQPFKRLEFRLIGPAAGGRVSRACGVPGDPNTYYLAGAASGVWKSTDAGIHWKPIFDDQLDSSIGSIAVAPSDPNVVYVGAGEANIRGNVAAGHGIYKSTDAGKTWKHVWKQEGQIGTLIIHPTNPDIAYAAVLGHVFGPNPERGVYRTTDGGATWKRVLFKDADTGASDVCFDPSNPRVLFAGLWQARRLPWEMTSGGPGSGLYVSRDGGDTWTHLVPPPDKDADREPPKGTKYCKGLPEGVCGKICVAVAPSDGERVYAMIENEKGGLFRSDDGGDSWERINDSGGIRQRPFYFSTITVHPTNADIVFLPQVPLLKSIDGGKTFRRINGPHHGDHHDLWIDPKDPRRMIDSNDGGVDVTVNGGETWYAPPLPICQFYRINVDERVPYHISGTMQDLGTASGPSNSLLQPGIGLADWHPVGGGETGHTMPDPSDPNIVYAGEYGGYLSRYDHRTRQAKPISIYPFNPSGFTAADIKYRFQWTAPVLISRHDPKRVYHGANILFRTSDGGQTWKAVSGDLTRNDRSKQKWSGGPITGDNCGPEVYGTIFALAESPKEKGVLWAGSDDGLVHVSRDDGTTWTNVTPPNMPEWGTVVCIEASPHHGGTAYVVVERHRLDDMKPYLFRTDDYGKSWRDVTGDLPRDVYLHAVREDPKVKGMLYVGTERGVAFSRDVGANWQQLRLNLPTVAVSDLRIKDDDLVVGTNGRSVWILDDLTPLRNGTSDVLAKNVHLFDTRPVYRWRYGPVLQDELHHGTEKNPPKGAIVHYHLSRKPEGDVVLDVLDAAGKVVRHLDSQEEKKLAVDEANYSEERVKKVVLPTEAGLHRVVWDLTADGPELIEGAQVDLGTPKASMLVPPGEYTLRLKVEGKSYETKLKLRSDPRVKETGLEEQFQLALAVRDDLTRLTRIVNRLRSLRQQLQTREELLKDETKADELLKASKALLERLDELEGRLHNPKARVAYDILAQKGGAKLYSQLAWLFELLKDADGAPPQGIREVFAEQHAELDALESVWRGLLTEVEKLNALAKSADVPGVIVPVR